MPAFEGAVRLGYRYVETDVHVTADGVLLAFHDDVLDRVTDRLRRSSPSSRGARCDRRRSSGREPIPLLEDLLGTFPDLRVNIDPKHDAAVAPLIDVIEKTSALDRVCVGSFSDSRVVDACARPWAPRSAPRSVRTVCAGLVVAAHGVPAGRFTSPCAQVPVKQGSVTIVNDRFLKAAHRRDIAVHVWTIDDDQRDGATARHGRRRDHDRPARGAAVPCSSVAGSGSAEAWSSLSPLPTSSCVPGGCSPIVRA